MTYLTIWLGVHRNLMLAIAGAMLWIFANYWYLRHDFARMRRERRPHAWSADLATRSSKGAVGKKRG